MLTHFITSEGKLGRAEHPKAKLPDVSQILTNGQQLSGIIRDWPMSRLVELWNTIPGVSPVRRFESRSIAIARLRLAIETLPPQSRLTGNKPEPQKLTEVPGEGTKTAYILALLQRPEGATLQQIMAATGWQSHSVRGFISGNLVKKRKCKVFTSKRDGARVYRIRQAND